MWPRVGELRALELGSPGEMQDRLNALVLAGEKVATAGPWEQDYVNEDEALEEVGERLVLLGADGQSLALVEVTRVETRRFVDVPWEFAAAEGEGFDSIEHWRAGHRTFFAGQGLTIDDDDLMVCVWFRLIGADPPAQ